MKENKFIIYSAGYNCERYIKLHMDMIQNQTYKNYSHIIVDDASTDGTYNIIKGMSDERTISFKNEKNIGPLANIDRYLYSDNKEDIVISVDLDDFLLHDHVLEILNKVYNDDNIWVTHSSFVWLKSREVEGSAYPKNIIDNNLFREYSWRAVHPQSFKIFLFDKINKRDFRLKNGSYLCATCDQAIMYPLLEMSSYHNIKSLETPLYVYNNHNPLNVMKIHKQYQIECENYIRQLPRYDKITI